jgi:hypothetical protein
MGKLIFILGLLFLFLAQPPVSYGSATDVWITQTGAGSRSGTDLSDAAPVSFMSGNGNCGSGPTEVGPGTTVHMSGTFTVPLNGQLVTWMNCSGAPGNKIWIKFEAGFDCTSVQMGGSPGSPAGGCITVNGENYIKIGSGASCGATTGGVDSTNSCNATIENTGYGTAFDLPGGVIPPSVGIAVYNCKGCEIAGVTIQNMYVQNAPWPVSFVSFNGSTGTIKCARACPVGKGIQIAIAGNRAVGNTTTLTVTANNEGGSTFTVTGGPASGSAEGGTAYDETQGGEQINNTCIYFNDVYSTATSGPPGTGNNWDASVHDFVCHDVGWALFASPAGTNAGLDIHNFVIYNAEHGWADGPSDSKTGTGPIVIHDFHMHDFGRWIDLPAQNNFHVDPFHAQVDFTNTVQDFFNNFTVFNGVIDGDMSGATNDMFMRASTVDELIFNMVIGCSAQVGNFLISLGDGTDWQGKSFTVAPKLYNNTVTCNNMFTGATGALHLNNSAGSSPSCSPPYHGLCSPVSENNIWQFGGNPMALDSGGSYTGTIDHDLVEDVYADGGGGGRMHPFAGPQALTYASCSIVGVCDSSGTSMPTLQMELGSGCLSGQCAQHDRIAKSSVINLVSTGALGIGSPAIGAGANLYSICGTATWPLSQLCYDRLGNARPSSGPWDIGAFVSGVVVVQPAAPTGLTATVE